MHSLFSTSKGEHPRGRWTAATSNPWQKARLEFKMDRAGNDESRGKIRETVGVRVSSELHENELNNLARPERKEETSKLERVSPGKPPKILCTRFPGKISLRLASSRRCFTLAFSSRDEHPTGWRGKIIYALMRDAGFPYMFTRTPFSTFFEQCDSDSISLCVFRVERIMKIMYVWMDQ